MSPRKRIENNFEDWARLIIRHPWKFILLPLLLSVILCTGYEHLRVEASTESFLQKNDPARLTYNEFRREFNGDETGLLLIQSDHIFTADFLLRLKALHEDVEANTPYLSKIDSLANARSTYGRGDELVVEDLLENWDGDESQVAAIKARALSIPLLQNTILSPGGNFTAINMSFTPGQRGDVKELSAAGFEDEDFSQVAPAQDPNQPYVPPLMKAEENAAIVQTLQTIIARHHDPEHFPIHLGGGPPMTYLILNAIEHDMAFFTVGAIFAIALLLFALFRRLSGVCLPVICVVIPLAGTFGLMGLLGLPVTIASQIMPSFLLAVGVADAVHLLAIFYKQFDSGTSREESLIFALGHSGLALVMTSVTTAGSLMSFLSADLQTLKDFGISAPIGVMLALLYSLTLLPALMVVIPIRRKECNANANEVGTLDRVLGNIGNFSTARPWAMVGVWSIICLGSVYGAVNIRFAHNPSHWFKESTPFRITMDLAKEEMGTGLSAEVLVDTGVENGLHDPETLRRVDEIQQYLQDVEIAGVGVGKVISVIDIIKETNQALNGNDPAFYVIPDSRELIAQELLLFENSGSDDLENVVDPLFQKARLTLLIPDNDALKYKYFIEEAQLEINRIAGDKATVHITGLMHLSARTTSAMMTSMAKSYTIALIVITILMIILIGDVRMGLLCMIPNVAPILFSLGFMYWFKFDLDAFSMLIGSIALGIAVDDTIHFMHNFQRYFQECGNAREAVHKTLLTTGRALLITSVVLSAGFFVFAGATIINIINFGIITGVAVIVAFLADVMLSPALVVIATRKQERSGTPGRRGKKEETIEKDEWSAEGDLPTMNARTSL